MIAICSVTVDIVATKLFPQKDLYYKFKYLETPELKDIQEGYQDLDKGSASNDEMERTPVILKK